jgi:putative transposase
VGRIARIRLVAEGTTNHCTWRSHNRTPVLASDAARIRFLELLARYKRRYQVRIQSYCLMGTHPHVMCRADGGQKAFSAFWKVVNQEFARFSNAKRGSCGQVVRERMRSPQIQAGVHQLTVMRYGDLNPVRAGLVRRPKDWKWSSYRHYAYGEENQLIDPAPEYLALGRTGPERRKAYQQLFAARLAAPLHRSRADLVIAPFVGSERWVSQRREALGLSPPC